MSSSVEGIWREEAGRRRRLRKMALIIGVIFILILLTVWILITQPLLMTGNRPDQPISVEPKRLAAHVEKLSNEFFPRDCLHPENLDRVAIYIRSQFEQAKARVSEQSFQVDGNTYRNIIAVFGPQQGERIVIGAHYDSAGARPAADDNASGVAGLIELAYLLGNQQLSIQIELVAYTLEEPPYFRTEFMGSAVHARSLKEQSAQVRVMFSLEMIGYFSDEPNSQDYPVELLRAFYPSRGNFITIVSSLGQGMLVRRIKSAMRAASELPVYSISAPTAIPGIDFSDHLNYWNSGYNAVMISDTAFYRNKRYHTMDDRPETLDYRRMAMVVAGVYSAVELLAK
jgi:hypothetical protein